MTQSNRKSLGASEEIHLCAHELHTSKIAADRSSRFGLSVDLIRKYFRRVREYERAYVEGKKAGKELEQAVKVYKSHRRIFFETHS